MPIHPAPPSDLPGLVAAFLHTGQAVADLGHRLTDDQFDLPTDCPGWTIKDHISHVVGVEAHLEGLADPALDAVPEDTDWPHVRHDFGRWMERAVQARRGRSAHDVVRELEHVLTRRAATLQSPGLDLDSIVPGVDAPGAAGPGVPVKDLLRIRCMDVWVHEQDIRAAIDAPGNLDSPAAAVFVAQAVRAVPARIARKAQVSVGDTVILELTGPVTARIGVRAAVLPLVRRVGFRGALALGAALGVLQFPPLLLAEDPVWLAVWVATVSFAEATYWPVFHAIAAVLGAEGQRGREIAERQVIGLGVSVAGPLLGGWLLGTYGPAVDFGAAACLAALSTLPVALLGAVPAGTVPTARESVRSADPIGTLAFAADGWISGGLGIAWPMVLFASLGERFEALGAATALGAAGQGALARSVTASGQRQNRSRNRRNRYHFHCKPPWANAAPVQIQSPTRRKVPTSHHLRPPR